MQQIEHERRDPLAVLHRRVDAFWKGGPRPHTAGRALAVVGAMFGNDGRPRGGQIEHLTDPVTRGHGRRQRQTALCASLRVMIDDFVGLRDLPQGLPVMTFLSTGLVAGALAQARHARRFLQPVARWWLAAVGTCLLYTS